MKKREPQVGIEPTTAKLQRRPYQPLTLIVVNPSKVAGFHPEPTPKQPPHVQLRATVAGFFAEVKRRFAQWRRELERSQRIREATYRLERYEGRDLTTEETDHFVAMLREDGIVA
jgi:hypothetical protein